MKIGFIGLGNMGLNIVKNLLDHGHEIVAWNRSPEPRIEAANAGASCVNDMRQLVQSLEGKRVVFSMVSAGPAVDLILFGSGEDSLFELLSAGDIFVDLANSHYKDTHIRAEKLAAKGIHMLDAGVSGGVGGARKGACCMVGGDEVSFRYVEQVFKDMSQENGYGYFGKSGSGHYVKMIHNAIEYGMMQAIGEGLNLLQSSEYKQNDMRKLLEVWNSGSIIESKLVGFLKESITKSGNLENLESEIGSLGTGMWASEEALRSGVPFTAITHAVYSRYESRGAGSLAFKVIQAMRAEFGAHTGQERESK